MSENVRCIRPRENMRRLFKEAEDNSLILYFCVSYSCDSQTGEGFREFVDTMNKPDYFRKIKKLYIVDTCYLYRHTIPAFSKYVDPSIPTEWEEKNKESLDSIKCDHKVIHWCDRLGLEEFKKWNETIRRDFDGNGNKNDIDIGFRDILIKEAAISYQKGHGNFQGCIDFILEETAYSCAFFHNEHLIYPGKMSEAILYSAKKYNKNMLRYQYSLARHASTLRDSARFEGLLEKSVTDFMRSRVSHVNFFIIDKHGEHVYKNYALNSVVGEMNAKSLGTSWENTKRVIETGKEMTVEERYNDNYYLSFKAPLVIDKKIEGIIGLAIDITDKKKNEILEIRNRIQDTVIKRQASFEKLIASVVHDMRSPLASLDMLAERNSLPEKEHIILRSAISKMKEICDVLLFGYKENMRVAHSYEARPILVPMLLSDAVSQKNAQLNGSNVKLTCSYDPKDSLTYITGDPLAMSSMMLNLINNAVEATSGNKRCGIVDVFMSVGDSEVRIIVQDNGKGMPRYMIDQVHDRVHVETTKKDGSGIGLGQIVSTIDLYNGTFQINSQEGFGTKFIISFPKMEIPKYIQSKITLRRGDVVLCLDDDDSMQYIWEKILYPYRDEVTLEFFSEAKDAHAFINNYKSPEDIFVISDYELRGQDTNGVYFILEHDKRDRSIIVTSITGNSDMYQKIECSGISMFPKQFLSKLEVKIEVPQKALSVA